MVKIMDLLIVETRLVPLLDGSTLTFEMTQPFIDTLRQHFGLFAHERVEDEHLRMYLHGAVDGAVKKVERGTDANNRGAAAEGDR